MNKKNIKKELTKARKFKNSTPGQDRDFETLDANRMFKAYEDVEIDEWGDTGILDQKLAKEKQAKQKLSITPAGKKALKKGDHKLSITPKGRKALYKANVAYDTAKQASKMKYMKKAEELEVEDAPVTSTGGVANWNPLLGGRKRKVDVYMKNRRKVDGRTKDYKETVQRLQARRDASAARELEQKLNMFGVQSNPFREETEMNNKKYLQTKEGGLESAVIQSLTTEAPVNPNDARPTLTLPKKYLSSRDGSLESAVQTVMIDETISGNMMRDLRALDGHQFQAKYRMTKAAAQSAGGGIQKYGRKGKVPKSDEHQREAVEDEFDYKAKKGAIAAPGSGSIAKAQKAKASDVNKSLEQQLAAARKEEVEIDELSKKTMGSYVKKASADAEPRMGNLERARGQAAATGQSADVDAQIRAHKPTMARLKSRPKGIARAADKLSKEEVEIDEQKPQHPGQKKGSAKLKKGWKMTQSGEPYFVPNSNNPARSKKEEVEIDEDKPTAKQVKMAKGIAWDKRHRGGDMTGAWKKAEKIKKGLGDHPKVADALRKANEETEDDRGVGSQAYTDYIRNLTPGEGAVTDKEAVKASSASKQASAEKKHRVTKIDDAVDPEVAAAKATYKKGSQDMRKQHILDVAKIKASKVGEEVIVGLLEMGIIKLDEQDETGFSVVNQPEANRENLLRMAYTTGAKIIGEKKEVDVPDTRRTVDAIRAYDRSKDASRDADYDTLHGKAKRGDIEKEYAKKERGEIDKDDPRWKHRKGHTGMHGEEVSYHDQLMDEAGKWIQKAIKKPGALRQQLGVPEGEKIPKSKLDAAAKEGGKLGQRARLAKTLSKMN